MTQVRNFTVTHEGDTIAAGQIVTGEGLSVAQRRVVMNGVVSSAFQAMQVPSDRERAVVLYRIADKLATGLDTEEVTAETAAAKPWWCLSPTNIALLGLLIIMTGAALT